ncbi:MAG: hypothetical protein HRU26_07505 [Psychroserpens sp.]|nr:hypothetical protein [Psychroserpens sp.]
MSSYVGGDILEISYNHPTLGSGSFFCKSGEDSDVDRGGFRKEDDDQGIAGDGQMMTKVNAFRWSVEATVAWSKTGADELLILSDIAASPLDASWTFRYQDGASFVGEGTIVGDLKGATQNSTVPIKIAGGNGLRRL